MAATEALLASSMQAEDSPDLIKICPDALDTEMTCPLTLDDKEKSRSRSASPANDNMSYNNGRDRSRSNGVQGHHVNGSNGSQNNSRFTSPGQNSSESWRPSNGGYIGQGSGFSPNNNGYGNDGFSHAHPQVPYDPSAPMLNKGHRPRASSMMPIIGEGNVALSNVSPGPVWPSEHQLNTAYAYGVRNEDGSFTRLIRADDINRFIGYNIPPRQGPEGLIIVPPPRVPSPNSRQGQERYVSRIITSQLPLIGSHRPSITEAAAAAAQIQIDTILANAVLKSPPRREKIYCDKWIHEGTCAFTQMGCKYKHVMPTDKATQVALGLNHGFPNWYRRAHQDKCNGAPGAPPAIMAATQTTPENSRAHMDDNWRRQESTQSGTKTSGGMNGKAHARTTNRENGAPLSGSYGPIARPHVQPSHNALRPRGQNLFNNLKTEADEEEEEDEVTWQGRNSGQYR